MQVQDLVFPERTVRIPMPSFSKKRSASSAGLTSGGVAKVVVRDHKTIAKLTRQIGQLRNRAYFDVSQAATALTNAGQLYSLVYVPSTADVSAAYRRIGDAITVTGFALSVIVRGSEDGAIISADAYNNVGMRLCWIRNPNGQGLPSTIVGNGKSVFFDNGGFTSDAGLLLPPLGFDLKDDVTIIQEKVITVAGLNTSATSVSNVKDHVIAFHKNYKVNKQIMFNSTSNVPASVEKNLLCLGFTGDSGITPYPYVSWTVRVYYDM